jgi:hypothetical protein
MIAPQAQSSGRRFIAATRSLVSRLIELRLPVF